MDRTVFLVLQAFMGLAMIVAPLSFIITVQERDGRWSMGSIGEVVVGICVGIGLMVNNSAGSCRASSNAAGSS